MNKEPVWLIGVLLLYTIACLLSDPIQSAMLPGHGSVVLNRRRRVIGGEAMSDKEHGKYPWAALLRGQNAAKRGSYHWCGASILDKEWLVTAAHCFWRTDDDDPFTIIDMRNIRHWHVSLGNVSVEHDRFLEILTAPDIPEEDYEVTTPRPYRNKNNFHFSNNFRHPNFRVDVNSVIRDLWQEHVRMMRMLRHLMDENNFSKWRKVSYREASRVSSPNARQSNPDTSVKSKTSSDHPYHYHLKKIFLHPYYRPHRIAYDIALIKLDKPVPEMDKWGVNLPEEVAFPPTDANCTLVGWGCTSDKGTASELSHSIHLEVMDFHHCNYLYRYSADLNRNHEFCAGYDNQDKGICRGDSGSGLVCHDKLTNKWVLAGIASATHGNYPSSYPGVFTRTSFAKNWILRIMQRHSSKNAT